MPFKRTPDPEEEDKEPRVVKDGESWKLFHKDSKCSQDRTMFLFKKKFGFLVCKLKDIINTKAYQIGIISSVGQGSYVADFCI